MSMGTPVTLATSLWNLFRRKSTSSQGWERRNKSGKNRKYSQNMDFTCNIGCWAILWSRGSVKISGSCVLTPWNCFRICASRLHRFVACGCEM